MDNKPSHCSLKSVERFNTVSHWFSTSDKLVTCAALYCFTTYLWWQSNLSDKLGYSACVEGIGDWEFCLLLKTNSKNVLFSTKSEWGSRKKQCVNKKTAGFGLMGGRKKWMYRNTCVCFESQKERERFGSRGAALWLQHSQGLVKSKHTMPSLYN